jgi:hypothetical protein
MRLKRRFKIKPGAQLPHIAPGLSGQNVGVNLLHQGRKGNADSSDYLSWVE